MEPREQSWTDLEDEEDEQRQWDYFSMSDSDYDYAFYGCWVLLPLLAVFVLGMYLIAAGMASL